MAFGLQSGGSTIISYCFLQRSDLDGVLDWFHDRLPEIPDPQEHMKWWCKCTIASFRAVETIHYMTDAGWDIRPVMVVRDVRKAFDSLLTKSYGRNATTAEDPPLRTRFRRFLEDWQYFRDNDLPITKLENFYANPERELRLLCSCLDLSWQEEMISWPKPLETVWNGAAANRNFIASIKGGALESINPALADRTLCRIRRDDLIWLEEAFETFNQINNYPTKLDPMILHSLPDGWAAPSIEFASRYWLMRIKRNAHRIAPVLKHLRLKSKLSS